MSMKLTSYPQNGTCKLGCFTLILKHCFIIDANCHCFIFSAKSPVISDLGMSMASLPVAPRYAKMLIVAREYKVLPYIVALVAALSVDEIFIDSVQPSEVDKNVSHKHNYFNVTFSCASLILFLELTSYPCHECICYNVCPQRSILCTPNNF